MWLNRYLQKEAKILDYILEKMIFRKDYPL